MGLGGIAVAVSMAQAPANTLYDKSLDAAWRWRVSSEPNQSIVTVALINRRDPKRSWNVAAIDADVEVAVERADSTSVVLVRRDDYGIDLGRTKLFIDIDARKLLKRIDYQTPDAIDFGDDATAAHIWVGRVVHPEGADRSGGLLRYDRKTHRASVLDVPDVIHTIGRGNGALFVGTANGLYVFRNGLRTRYRAEPGIDGHFAVVRETY